MRTNFILLLLFFAAANIEAQNSFVKDSLDVYVTREMSRWKIPGVAVAIVKNGKPVVVKGYGVREEGKPGKVDALSRLAVDTFRANQSRPSTAIQAFG